MRWLLAFCTGSLILPLLPSLPNPWWLAVPAAACALAGVRFENFRFLGVLAAALAGLLLATTTARHVMDNAWPESLDGETVSIKGRISGLTEVRERQFRFELLPLSGQDETLPKRIQVNWYFPAGWPQAGEHWQMDLRLRAPGGRVNPGAFDSERWLLTRRIGATATVKGRAQRLESATGGRLTRTRQRLSEWLQATTINADVAALHRALAIADRGGISSELSERLRRTGTAHLLAISGLHIGMIFLVAAALGGWLGAPLCLIHASVDRRRVALVCGLLAAIAYACLAGFTLPTRRALVMLGVVACAFFLRRGIRPGHALLLALAAVLLIDPLAPLATGFWLSFAAVAVLIWAFAWRPGRPGWAPGLLRAQLIIAVGMLPLNIGVFGQWVPVAIPANLLAIPLVGFWILPMLLLAVFMEALGIAYSEWPLAASETGLHALTTVLTWLESLPAGWWPIAGGGGAGLTIAIIGALWLIAPRGVPARWLGLAMLLPVLIVPRQTPDEGELDVWVMDLGDGFAVSMQTARSRWLFDTGRGDGQGRDQVAGTLEPLLRQTGSSALDGLILSHDNRNHTGGLPTVLDRLQPVTVLAGPGMPYDPCLAGQSWRVDGVAFEILHPAPGLPDLGYDSACVLAVDTAGGKLLIAGGIGPAVGDRLAAHGPDPKTDVLVTSRARLSKSPAFIEAAAPGRWITSKPVETDIMALNTGRCGAVHIRFRTGSPPEVISWRDHKRRFWRRGCDGH